MHYLSLNVYTTKDVYCMPMIPLGFLKNLGDLRKEILLFLGLGLSRSYQLQKMWGKTEIGFALGGCFVTCYFSEESRKQRGLEERRELNVEISESTSLSWGQKLAGWSVQSPSPGSPKALWFCEGRRGQTPPKMTDPVWGYIFGKT